jgi:hypothetical protein
MIYISGIAGVLVPTVIVLGVSPVIHQGAIGALGD